MKTYISTDSLRRIIRTHSTLFVTPIIGINSAA